jgi:hypothetical protein
MRRGCYKEKSLPKGIIPFTHEPNSRTFLTSIFADAKAKRPGAHPVLGAGFGEMDPSIGANLRHAKVNHP